ncbi:MAG: LacI family DNA-binding transcriptional regulator [Treponema sp.]|jgi:LacI family repressor for deo operon, udp, cdd, tsx, nupC, and nupG|nr:LacI family DNA-binding transcriptional regulator [Treponema sp.]
MLDTDIMDGKKPNYQRIAEETGISIATISRVFTGASNVKADTRRRVIDTLKNYGYDTSSIEERGRIRENRLIILNVPSTGNPFYNQIIHGAKAAATQRGCHLLLNEDHINDSTIDNLLRLLRKTQVAGLITTNHMAPVYLKRISETVPLVQCCEYDDGFDLPYVSIDDVAATKTAMEYLFSLGRKNIAFINGPIRYKYAKQRLQGYLEALDDAGIPSDPQMILQLSEINYDLAVSAATNLFDSGKRPNAFFCASDVLAAAAIKVGIRKGVSVPNDLAVIGFDNVDISVMMNPTITTISQPQFQLGFSSCELLIEHITNPQRHMHNIVFATELLVRESTTMKQG